MENLNFLNNNYFNSDRVVEMSSFPCSSAVSTSSTIISSGKMEGRNFGTADSATLKSEAVNLNLTDSALNHTRFSVDATPTTLFSTQISEDYNEHSHKQVGAGDNYQLRSSPALHSSGIAPARNSNNYQEKKTDNNQALQLFADDDEELLGISNSIHQDQLTNYNGKFGYLSPEGKKKIWLNNSLSGYLTGDAASMNTTKNLRDRDIDDLPSSAFDHHQSTPFGRKESITSSNNQDLRRNFEDYDAFDHQIDSSYKVPNTFQSSLKAVTNNHASMPHGSKSLFSSGQRQFQSQSQSQYPLEYQFQRSMQSPHENQGPVKSFNSISTDEKALSAQHDQIVQYDQLLQKVLGNRNVSSSLHATSNNEQRMNQKTHENRFELRKSIERSPGARSNLPANRWHRLEQYDEQFIKRGFEASRNFNDDLSRFSDRMADEVGVSNSLTSFIQNSAQNIGNYPSTQYINQSRIYRNDSKSNYESDASIPHSTSVATSLDIVNLTNSTSNMRISSDQLPRNLSASNLESQRMNISDEINYLYKSYQNAFAGDDNEIEKAATVYRNSATYGPAATNVSFRWTGDLPSRNLSKGQYSRRVFLGGVPWDSKEDDLIASFSHFGSVSVMWPQKDHYVARKSLTSLPKGYCYIVFDKEQSVSNLLRACFKDSDSGGDFIKLASLKFKEKDVQVIPWCINDSTYLRNLKTKPDPKKTVFIGALHGMITAEGLSLIMEELFGTVLFAALDTDKYKYPIGSGRVTFERQSSYMRAVTANFVEVHTSCFTKTIQIDPYLEDSQCNHCSNLPGIYFCRSFECFRYFCPNCWKQWHQHCGTFTYHKPLRRTFKPILAELKR